ncbi:TPA: hypothetical protein ACH3X2_004176 [Trebouxia sp. C0005]
MSTVHSKYNHLGRKRQRSDSMPVAMHYPRLTETTCCDDLMRHQHSNLVRVSSRVQVSLEDAEVLLGTAERTNIAGQATYVPYKTCEQRFAVTGAHEAGLVESSQLPLQLLSNHLDASELQRSVSGPLNKNGAEDVNCLHKSYSLPNVMELPGQDASPPVKVPKGMRSNRLRRLGPNATALGVKGNGGTSRVAKSSSTVQDEFIKSFRPSPAKKSAADTSGMLLLLEACDALAANPLLADKCPEPFSAARGDDWAAASPIAKGTGSCHKTRRVNLMEEGAYDNSTGNGRRIRKPLDNDFLYYAQAGSAGGSDYTGQAGCDGAQEGRGPWGEEAFWNPGGRRRGGRGELQGPCNHCFAEDSPQWRKGPRCKPVLCNACGTRFLRTRSLGKVRNTKAKVREQSRFAEASLDDMMDEDAEADYPAGTAHGWGALVKHDSLVHEQDNVSSSTTVPGMNMGFGVPAAMPGCDFHATEEHHMMALTQHEDCASAAVSE